MRGRILRSAVGHAVLTGLCLSGPLYAGQNPPSQDPEPDQAEHRDGDNPGTVFAEGLILPPFDPEAVWIRPDPEPSISRPQIPIVSAPFNLGGLFENFDIHNGPVRHGMPTHMDLTTVTTPVEFSTPALIEFDVVGWAWKSR